MLLFDNPRRDPMARLFSISFVLALALSTMAYAQSSVAGAWELSINGPEGVLNATADLKQDGDKLTGTITSPQGSVDLKGTYKDKKVELAFSIQGPNGAMDIKVNGEVDGSDMKGIIDFGMGMADFTAKKK
jgi:hypothetical protein